MSRSQKSYTNVLEHTMDDDDDDDCEPAVYVFHVLLSAGLFVFSLQFSGLVHLVRIYRRVIRF